MRRITYQRDGKQYSGVVIGTGETMGVRFLIVKNDASGLTVNVLPQWVNR